MTKSILFFFLLFLFNLSDSFSQQYKLFQEDSLRLYRNPTTNKLDGLFFDSLSISGLDSTYYNFGIFRYTNTICTRIDNPIFIGRKVIARNDGYHVLFNERLDSIFINTLAEPGDSWDMYNYTNGDKVRGQVINIDTMTIRNSLDSVKTISLQLTDSIGNSLFSNLNSQTFELSKNHGIRKTAFIPEFPDTFIVFQLENVGMMTYRDFYNFSIGDTIQSYSQCQLGTYPPFNNTYTTQIICDKYYSLGLDTLFFSGDCILYSYITDLDQPVVSGYPGRIRNNLPHYYELSYDSSCFGRLLIVRDAEYSNVYTAGIDSCYFEFFEPGVSTNIYYPNMGYTASYFSDPPTGSSRLICFGIIVYYSSGSKRCGNFYNPINAIEDENGQRKVSDFLKFAPNPINNTLNIIKSQEYLNEVNISIDIYSVTGQLLMSKNMSRDENHLHLNFDSYPGGSYFFVAKTSNNLYQRGYFIKLQ